MLSSPDVTGRSLPVVPAGGSSSVGTANPVGSDGPVVAGGPLSPLFHDALGPLEHLVPDETILGLDPLEHSGLDHAGPVGRHVARDPVGPDETLLGLDPLEYLGLDHADPAPKPLNAVLSQAFIERSAMALLEMVNPLNMVLRVQLRCEP